MTDVALRVDSLLVNYKMGIIFHFYYAVHWRSCTAGILLVYSLSMGCKQFFIAELGIESKVT